MERKLRTELFKMSGIMLVLLGLGIYARDFVIAGIQAKMALNLSIFAIFGLAAAIAFKHVLALRNEILALRALQVDHGVKSRRPKDPYAKPAILFHEPELLGEGYHLIAGELGKQGDLQISTAAVQTLLHDVDQRINDRKSTIIYFSGLMVFLGLLGAFMGLMKTVHSVSELIGAMDVSGTASADSFGKMIEGMKAPLNGMSVGFSSSLFGLMTSMVLGALERCMTSAMKALRNEFERWLSSVAALEGSATETAASSSNEQDLPGVRRAIDAGARELAAMREVLGEAARQSVDTQEELGALAETVSTLADVVKETADPKPFLEPISRAVAELANNQMVIMSQMQALYLDAEADRAELRATLGSIGAVVDHTAKIDATMLHRQLDQLVALEASRRHRFAESEHPSSPVRKESGWASWVTRPFFKLGDAMERTRSANDNRRAIREIAKLRKETRRMLAVNQRQTRQMQRELSERIDAVGHDALLPREAVRLLAELVQRQSQLSPPVGEPLAPADSPASLDARAQLEMLRTQLNARIDRRSESRKASIPHSVQTSVARGSF
jgi:hypothetical protein